MKGIVKLKTIIIVGITKLISIGIQFFFHRSASTWPGHIALKLDSDFIQNILQNQSIQIIFVAGTNGKTTTSSLIRHLIEQNSISVLQNQAGANLTNGIASSLVQSADWQGKFSAQCAVFEVDENSLPVLLGQVKPKAIVIMNLFRDQLDRYGEVNVIADKWRAALNQLTEQTHLILNGDDPQIYFLGKHTSAKVSYFGLGQQWMTEKPIPHDVDSVYCPECGEKLNYKVMSFSHLGDFHCGKCGFKREKVVTFAQENFKYPLKGVYNMYNVHAAILAVQRVFSFNPAKIAACLNTFQPAFGRQETITYQNRSILVLLSKNPTGFNQSIEFILTQYPPQTTNLLILLNDRIPDGRDVSWIWDVEYQKLIDYPQIFLGGDRVFDLAIRFQYCFPHKPKVLTTADSTIQFEHITLQPDFAAIVKQAVNRTDPKHTLVILPTYSAMLDCRKLLTGKEIL